MIPRIIKLAMKDGSQINLGASAIVALVGPNNSGKSHFLRQLEALLAGRDSLSCKVEEGLVDSLEISWNYGADLHNSAIRFVRERLIPFRANPEFFEVANPDGFDVFGHRDVLQFEEIMDIIQNQETLGPLSGLFVRSDDPISRAKEASLVQLADDTSTRRMREDSNAFEAVATGIREVFDVPLSIYEDGRGGLGLKLSEFSNTSASADRPRTEAQKAEMEAPPKAWLQGLGIRSVLGTLLRIYSSNQNIILIDEPEAFLHPPQAVALGRLLRKVAAERDLQIFCATHDRNFLSGLSAGEGGASDEVDCKFLRLRRDSAHLQSQYGFDFIDSGFSQEVRSIARLRYTSILDGLFSDAVVLVENETDALFYSEALSASEKAAEQLRQHNSPAISFLGVSGKNNFESTARLLLELKVPVIVIADSDLVATKKTLVKLIETLSIESTPILEEREKIELDVIESIKYEAPEKVGNSEYLNRRIGKALKGIKEGTKIWCGMGNIRRMLGDTSLCLVPNGELEDFSPGITAHGGDWIREALDAGVHRSQEVEDFVLDILRKLFRQIE